MIGVAGCSAQADSGATPTATPTATTTPAATPTATPTGTAAPTGSPTATPSRALVKVELNPSQVPAGETSRVWILANCPVPTGGPAHTGTATSRAFVTGVVLNPDQATPGPWVRGEAQVSGTVARGSYRVDVKCDGTNDTGRATLRIVRPDPLPSDVPTRAPRAGGGGTFGKDVEDESSLPLGPAGVVLGLAAVAGLGIALRRRSRA